MTKTSKTSAATKSGPLVLKLSQGFTTTPFLAWFPTGKSLLVGGTGRGDLHLLTIEGKSAKEVLLGADVPHDDLGWGDGEVDRFHSLVPGALIALSMDGKELGRLELPSDLNSFAVAPDGGFAFGSKKQGVVLYDAKGKRTRTVLKKPYAVGSFDPSGTLLLLWDDQSMIVADLDGKIRTTLRGTTYGLPQWSAANELVTFVREGAAVGQAEDWSGLVRIRIKANAKSTQVEPILAADAPSRGRFSIGGGRAALVYQKESRVDVYDLSTQRLVGKHVVSKKDSEMHCALASNGTLAAAVNWEKRVHVFVQ